MLAHHTIGGCPLQTGDLLATGTISGPTRRELGCLLEASLDGIEPYEMEMAGPGKRKASRKYLEDGDIVEFKALGFGICKAQLLPNE
jgi:fumarylacetoacetase